MIDSGASTVAGGSLTIVCSDAARNGKTNFAKLAADLLSLRHGQVPIIFDTASPDGGLVRQFPGAGRVIDLSRTREQMALFDTIISEPKIHYLVDLEAHYFKQFFAILRDIGFEDGAKEAGLDIVAFYLIDRTAASVETAAELARSLHHTKVIPVRNQAIGDALHERDVADLYQSMRFEREVLLPELSAEALGMLEHPDFHFDAFVAGHYEHLPFEMRAELWDFLEGLYEQRGSAREGASTAI